MIKKVRKKVNYVNNKDFLEALIKYKSEVKQSEIDKTIKPVINDYLAECFIEIATRLTRYYKFVGYSYKDEMIGDGIENCIKVVTNFDPEKSANPFAYFTQIIYMAFVRRIKTEKKYLYTKLKTYEDFKSTLNTIPDDFKLVFENHASSDFDSFANEFINDYEKPKIKVIKEEEKQEE